MRRIMSLRRSFVIHVDVEHLQSYIPSSTIFDTIYAGTPLSTFSPKIRGSACEIWARNLDESATDAERTLSINGGKRGSNQTEYDFLSNGNIRVEVKSSSLIWDKTSNRFKIKFACVKDASRNDEVRLVTYTPYGLYVHRWNGKFRSRYGVLNNSHGHHIIVTASRDVRDWNEALRQILQKDFGTLLNFTSWENISTNQLFDNARKNIFEGLPLSHLSPSLRGRVLADWVRSFDSMTFDPEISYCFDSVRKRGLSNASYDYLRDSIRVEVKSAAMVYDKCEKRWKFCFYGVKEDNFDELRLVFYSPRGIYVFVYDGGIPFHKCGTVTHITGEKVFKLGGPKYEENWDSALSAILNKPIGSLIIQCDF